MVSVSASVLLSHATSELFPWIPLALFVVGVVLLDPGLSRTVRMAMAVLAGTGYLSYIFLFTWPSLVGRDPDKVAVAVSRVMEFNSVDGLTGYYFYSSIPGFHLFVASLGEIMGISGKHALMLFGVSTPLFLVPGAVLLARSWSTPGASRYATVLTMVSTAVLYYGIRPVPQLFAVVLWPSFLVLVDGYAQENRSSYFVALTIVATALLYAHKLSLLVVLGATLAAGGVEFIRKRWDPTARVRTYVSLSITFGALFVIQQLWLTEFFRAIVVYKLPGLLDGRVGAPTQPSDVAFEAVPLLPRTAEVAVGNADWLLFTVLAGIGWIVLIWWMRKKRTHHTVILGAGAVSGALIVLSYIIPTGLATKRVVLFATVPFAAIIAISLHVLSNSRFRFRTALTTSIILLFLVSQLAVVSAVPDHPYGTRSYLSPQEVDGKQWSNAHATDTVAADFFYAREIVDFDRPNQTYITGSDAVARGYFQVSERYLNATVTEQGYPYVLYRPGYERYRATNAWRLTWNPETEFDRTHSRVFDNGGAILYRT
jgi:hypothetical protein